MGTTAELIDQAEAVRQVSAALRRGDLDQADAALTQVSVADEPAACRVAGELRFRQGRWEEAARLLAQLEQRDVAANILFFLARNFTALRAHRPELLEHLQPTVAPQRHRLARTAAGAVSVAHVAPAGEPQLLSPGGEPAAALERTLVQLEPHLVKGLPLALHGVGDGYLLAALARRPPQLFMDQQQAVHLVEPDCELLAVCMMLHDWSDPDGPIAQQRFRWHVGPQWAQSYQRAMTQELFIPPPMVCVQQGTQGEVLRLQAEAIMQHCVELEQRLRRRLDDYYATLSADALSRLFHDAPPRPPRALVLTSRFTTVLQYSARDAMAGLEKLGWHTQLLIEPEPYARCTAAAILETIDQFRPDVLLTLDHLRASTPDLLPPGLMHLCWVQDLLPHLMTPQAAKSVGLREFVLTFARPLFVNDLNYPPRQCLDMPMMLAPRVQRPRTWRCDGPDLVYVSHLSGDPGILVDRILTKAEPALQPLLQSVCRWLVGEYKQQRSLPTKYHLRKALAQHATELQIDLPLQTLRALVDQLWNPLNIALYRQQALRWVADAADDLGLTLALYGSGWQEHERFALYARGVVTPGDDLATLVRQSKINLNLEPYPCVTHNRLLAGLAAGGFFLIRAHPANTLIEQLSNHLSQLPPEAEDEAEALSTVAADKRAELASFIDAARCICFDRAADPVRQTRSYERAGIIAPGEPMLPHLDEVSFADAASCREQIQRWLSGEAQRRQVQAAQCAAVESRLSADAGLFRVLRQIAARLADEPCHASGGRS